ncbi:MULTISPECIES: LysR family transcriptional regulator [Lactobacillus]|uniref:LysR family transcriptional regulator n=1 Tax=Lactobacillus TaxID=1578 RepID=UPI000CD9A532|nr:MULTISPECIES: LysR family transcriptional regulator [Lactobacillus]RVU77460.1 LysR family transcriptional regulator [Lactobacillus xujianguonis]
MEFKDLEYFQKLVETKSYIETANYFHVTQPAITAMVKRLEKEVDTKLIFKINNRAQMNITPAGLVVYRQAKNLLQAEQAVLMEAKRASENNFRLGYSEIAGSAWLASVITQLNQGHLLASIETHQDNSEHLVRNLREGKYDAILFSKLSDEQISGIKITNLRKYQYDLIVPANSELARQSEIDIFQTRNIPLIMRHKRFLSRIALEKVKTRTGFKPNKKLVVDSIDATTQLISKGMGIGYLMNLAVKNRPGVVAVPLIPSQQVDCYACLAVREDFIPNQIQEKCLEILRNF